MAERTILVVEDHAGIRESLLDLLQDEGYQAIGAANGNEALRRLEVLRPALILLDLMMPGMNGAELSAWLSRNPALATIPVVVLTASRQAPLDSGIQAVGWLQKPFAIEELLALVKKHMVNP